MFTFSVSNTRMLCWRILIGSLHISYSGMCQVHLIFEFKVEYFYFGAENDRLSGTLFTSLQFFLLSKKYDNSTGKAV